MDKTAPDAPTIADLREIAEFIRQRSLDEAGAAGRMGFYRENGVTIQVCIPKGKFPEDSLDGHRANATAWLEEHSPDRFMDMAGTLAHMADGLAEAVAEAQDVYGPYPARAAWRRLTRAARLWETHPDFNPAWAKKEETDDA